MNPRRCDPQRFSRPPQSAALPSFLKMCFEVLRPVCAGHAVRARNLHDPGLAAPESGSCAVPLRQEAHDSGRQHTAKETALSRCALQVGGHTELAVLLGRKFGVAFGSTGHNGHTLPLELVVLGRKFAHSGKFRHVHHAVFQSRAHAGNK